MKNVLRIVFLFIVTIQLSAQENIFLNRDYWKGQPSIESIDANIAKGFDITAMNSGAFDGVCYAIFSGNSLETIEHLLSKGNSVKKITHDARTYLFWAVSNGNLELAKMLVAKGSDVSAIDSKGHSVLLFAATTGQQDPKLYDLLLEKGADLKSTMHDGRNALHLLIRRSEDFKMVDRLISKGLNIHSVDDNGNGIFNYAASAGNLEVLKELVKRGVSYNVSEKTGENAILFASGNAKNTIAYYEYLEGLGLKANVVSNSGVTPLHKLARSSKNQKVYNYFIGKGVDANKADAKGVTALQVAAARNELEIVDYFVSNTDNINLQDKNGNSALTNAVKRNSPEVVNFLISKKANVNVVDRNGNNLGFHLIKSYRSSAVAIFEAKLKTLRANGLNIKDAQKSGSSLFHLAMDKNDVALLKRVKELGIDINAKDGDGNTVLHLAALTAKNDKILKYLLSAGASVKAITTFEETAFDLASENEILAKNKTNISFLK